MKTHTGLNMLQDFLLCLKTNSSQPAKGIAGAKNLFPVFMLLVQLALINVFNSCEN